MHLRLVHYCRVHQHEDLNDGSILAMYVCMYVCMCQSRSGMSICTHLHSRACLGTHASFGLMMDADDREEQRSSSQWRMGRTARLVLCNVRVFVDSSAEHSQQLATMSNNVNVQKMPRGQEENKRK